MSIDREVFREPMTKHSAPPWHCPTCGHGTLEPLPDTIVKVETAESRQRHDHPEFDWTWVQERFVGILKCNRKDCEEHVCVIGAVETKEEWCEHTQEPQPVDVYRPEFFRPPLLLFTIPEECPESVAAYVRKSFELFWNDPASALNKVRQAVEALLTHMRVPRYSAKRKSLTLHARIQFLLNKEPALGKILLAAKWLGNEGSHVGKEPGRDDVFDALDLFQHVLEEVIGRRTRSVERLSQQINRAKGVRKKMQTIKG